MNAPAAPPIQKSPTALTPTSPLLQSRLFLFWAAVAILLLQIFNNGYFCFRLDHTSQIPLIYMQQDPTLYQRDWFLHGFGHFELRYYHLLLMKTFALPLGLPAGILALYFITILSTIWAWLLISKKVHGSPLPGILAGFMSAFMYGQEIGTNHLFEKEMIPRTEAYPFAYFALYCALCGQPFLSGLLLAVGGLFQPAVGLLFAAPIAIWLMTRPEDARKLKTLGFFLLGFVLPFAPRAFSLRQAIQDNGGFSANEEILLAGYIRHPHHMIPHLWGTMWLMFAAMAALFIMVWRRRKAERPGADPLARMGLIVIGILAVATLFIEVLPVKLIVLVQPFRMAVLLYFIMILTISTHLLELLRRPEWSAKMRALLLILAPPSRFFFILVALIELALSTWERRKGKLKELHAWGILVAAVALTLVLKKSSAYFAEDLGDIYRTAPIAALALLGAGWAVSRFRLHQRPALAHAAGAALAAAGLIAIGCFYWLPLEARFTDPKAKSPEKLAELCWNYEFKPIPVKAIERIGVWASQNTPKDALFIMPPEPQAEGFQVWSKRAAVFCFKYIPLKTAGLKEWKERFLAMRGITDPASAAAQQEIDKAMKDYGGLELDKAYDSLTPAQTLAVAKKYGADYIITQNKYDEADKAHFHYVFQETNRNKKLKNSKPYFVYKLTL